MFHVNPSFPEGTSTARRVESARTTLAKRARLDYQRTKALIPAARKQAWAESLRGLRVIATAAAVLVALALAMNVMGQR